MKLNSNARRLTMLSVLLGSIVMIGVSDSAFAMSSPGLSQTDPVVVGSFTTITIERSGDAPHLGFDADTDTGGIRVYDPTASNNQDDGSFFQCALPSSTDGQYWELRDATNGDLVIYKIPDTLGEEVSVTFGKGTTQQIVPTANSQVGTWDGSTQSFLSAGTSMNVQWYNMTQATQGSEALDTANSDELPETGSYVVVTCGEETANFANDFQTGDTFKVQLPVGGSIIPIETTSLMVAGLAGNAMWLVPVATAMAAAGLGIYRLKR